LQRSKRLFTGRAIKLLAALLLVLAASSASALTSGAARADSPAPAGTATVAPADDGGGSGDCTDDTGDGSDSAATDPADSGTSPADGGSDDGGDDCDGGPEAPWVMYYAKESSGQPITQDELDAAAQQADRLPDPDKTAWQVTGPTNVGGRATDLVVDPSHTDTIYVAAAGGGIWKSTDEGSTFSPAWPANYPQTMGALAIGPDGTLWAGTGEANPAGGGMTYFGNGVYKSADGGKTWTNVGLTSSDAIGRIVVNPSNPNEVWVAAAGSIYLSSQQRGIYHTTDGGKTWTLALAPPNDTTGGIDIALDPANPNVVYAALWDHHRDAAARTYGGVGSGLYRSEDDGATWTRLQNITTPLPTYDRAQTGLTSDASLGRIGIAVAPSDPNRVYVISGDTNGFDKGFFVSNDGGNSFQTAGRANNNSEYQWWFGRVWVDPGNENHLFAADVSLRQSFDGGQTWSNVGSVHADQHAMAFDLSTVSTASQSAERIYLGNDGGVYHTDADGTTAASWVHATYEPWNQAYHIALSTTNDNRIAAGLQDNGSVRTWTAASPDPADPSLFNAYGGGDGHYVAIDPANEDIYYQCSQNGSCGGVQDNPSTGTQTTLRFGHKPGTRFTTDAPLVIDPANPSVLYIGGNVLDRSTDGGATWTQISPSDPADLPGVPPTETEDDPVYANTYATISAVAPATTSPDPNGYANTIYAGTDTGYVWKTTDAGQTWTQMTGLPQLWVNSITVDPTDANRAWVAFSGFRVGDNTAHLYETTDGGATWTPVDSKLPNAPIEDVIFDQPHSTLYAATDLGVFFAKEPPGAPHPTPLEWKRVGTGLPATPDMDLKIDGTDSTLFVGTFGRGIWKIPLPNS
jgi:photosystem II stability/assembly factor-like uncharacterized protein